ncbi:hypothetical protein HWV62_23733 [Athelia sp. TMB]|nr:hypothetical protein HWV62_23733 [Athelia sp. TMB]
MPEQHPVVVPTTSTMVAESSSQDYHRKFCYAAFVANLQANGEIDPEKQLAQERRKATIEGRLGGRSASGGATSQAGPSTGAMTSASELSNLRSNVGKAAHFTIFVQFRLSTKPGSVDKSLGTTCRPYPEDTTFFALKEDIVQQLNVQWTTKHVTDLLVNETELRARNNITFPQDTDTLTIRKWYGIWNQPETRDAYITIPAGMGKIGKSLGFCLELFIDYDSFLQRTSSEDDDAVLGTKTGKKRKASGSHTGSKRRKGSQMHTSILTSSFRPDSEAVTTTKVLASNKIHFRRTVCTINLEDGKPTCRESTEVENGLLDIAPMSLSAVDRGKTKEVFAVLADLIRIGRMSHFAKGFRARADRENVEIEYFQVSDAFIMKAYDPVLERPVEKDPIPPGMGSEDEEDPITSFKQVFLVEPRRLSSAVIKFSGTLGVTNRNEKRSATMTAFSHWVIENTACEYMFADIQGSLDRDARGDGGTVLTLFDPMTHTHAQTSGLGDHGALGFKDFIDSHQCNFICRQLKLAPTSVLQEQLDIIEETAEEELA